MTTQATGQLEGPVLSDEEKEKIRKQLQESAGAAEVGSEKLLAEAIQKRDDSNMRDVLGLDLDFDPLTFITQGIIVRKNLEVVVGKVFVDMKSLTTKDRMLAEAMVRDRFGNMRLDNVYLTAIEAAMMAVSIIRINSAVFPNPDISKPMTDELNKKPYEAKNILFDMFLDTSNELVTMLPIIYKNLEAVAVPTVETQKKS